MKQPLNGLEPLTPKKPNAEEKKKTKGLLEEKTRSFIQKITELLKKIGKK